MTARRFTANYREVVALRDGTRVVLRLVRPEDREILRRGFERWSQQSRYTRFFSAKSRLTEDELTYLCDVDQEQHFALGATREDDPHVGLGIARFIRLPESGAEIAGPITAEAAIAVADEVHGQGLGRILLERLEAAAAERDIERFRCHVLRENDSMRGLIENIAPVTSVDVDDEVVSIDFELPAVTEPAGEQSALYRFFRGVAKMGPWGLIASRWSHSS